MPFILHCFPYLWCTNSPLLFSVPNFFGCRHFILNPVDLKHEMSRSADYLSLSTPAATQWQTMRTAQWGQRGKTSASWSQARAALGRRRHPRRSCSTTLSPVPPVSMCRPSRTACCSPTLCWRWDAPSHISHPESKLWSGSDGDLSESYNRKTESSH